MMHAFGYFCILYRKRFSIYSDCTFLHSSKGLITHFFHLHMLSFVFVNKQIKTPQKNKKLNIREMYINLKGEKIIFPNREKDRWKRKKIYLRVLRLRSWSVSMRSLNPWWTVRRSCECGDEVEPPSSLPSVQWRSHLQACPPKKNFKLNVILATYLICTTI